MPVDHGRDRHNPPIEPPTLASGRWQLRPIRLDDAPFLFEVMTDPGMIRARSADPPTDEAQVVAWIRSAIRASNAGTSCTWIVENDHGVDIGLAVLQELDLQHGIAEAGYFVCPEHRGAGAATAALDAVTTWAFRDLRLTRVQLFHDTDNPASCRVATGAGFAIEGTLRSSRRRSDGSRADQEVHARLVTDPGTPLDPCERPAGRHPEAAGTTDTGDAGG